jgi:hypothetical protein
MTFAMKAGWGELEPWRKIAEFVFVVSPGCNSFIPTMGTAPFTLSIVTRTTSSSIMLDAFHVVFLEAWNHGATGSGG